MAIVAMADAVTGTVALSGEYNHVTANVRSIDARVTSLEGSLSGTLGRVAGANFNTAGPTGIAATEIIFDAVSATLVAGRRYRVMWNGVLTAAAPVSSYYNMRMRYVAGAGPLTASGTVFFQRNIMSQPSTFTAPSTLNTGGWDNHHFMAEFIAPSSGVFQIGMGMARVSASGSYSVVGASDNIRVITVDDVGV